MIKNETTEKDNIFLEDLKILMESKNLWVDLEPKKYSFMVLKEKYAEKIHKTFKITKQGNIGFDAVLLLCIIKTSKINFRSVVISVAQDLPKRITLFHNSFDIKVLGKWAVQDLNL